VRSLGSLLAWLLPFLLLMLGIIAVPLRMLDGQGLPRYRALRSELHAVRADNQRKRHRVRSLKRHVQQLRDDPTAVERIARDELGMLREGEILFQFPD
jgi:cell division protein FtsB